MHEHSYVQQDGGFQSLRKTWRKSEKWAYLYTSIMIIHGRTCALSIMRIITLSSSTIITRSLALSLFAIVLHAIVESRESPLSATSIESIFFLCHNRRYYHCFVIYSIPDEPPKMSHLLHRSQMRCPLRRSRSSSPLLTHAHTHSRDHTDISDHARRKERTFYQMNSQDFYSIKK